MTNDEIIADAKVPGTRSVFILGCLESRVTLYAQQVRALNLVNAIIEQGLIRANGRIAIIGGGAAGITAAAAFALAMPNLVRIDIYERKEMLLHLQVGNGDRYLHPHLYDWPNEGSTVLEAGLPLLNWTAGTAGEVADHLLSTFLAIQQHTQKISVKTLRRVERVDAALHAGCRVTVEGMPGEGGFYDIAILSVGFGYEQYIDNEKNHSYWAPHPLSGPIRRESSSHVILISGNGDGGLVDFLTATFEGVSHREICEFIVRYPGLESALRVLLDIEDAAWSSEKCAIDIFKEYEAKLLPELPPNLLLDVTDKFRPGVEVLLHTRESRLFRRESAVLNRFGAFLAIMAERNRHGETINTLTAVEFRSEPDAELVTFENGDECRPNYRFLRFGPDKRYLSPFEDHIRGLQGVRATVAPGLRPATPLLGESAKSRFQVFSPRFGTASPRARAEKIWANPRHIELLIQSAPSGLCTWACDVSPADAARLWKDRGSVTLFCDIRAESAGPLLPLVARLAGHAPRCDLYCSDAEGWGPAVARYVDTALPGPDVDVRFAVSRPTGSPPVTSRSEVVSSLDLAMQVHAVLDLEVIERLHAFLHASLASPPRRSSGWELETNLKRRVLETWDDWHGPLKAQPDVRRRFLSLLSCLDDEEKPSDNRLVCIGPKIIRSHLLRATILALAVTVAMDDKLAPAGNRPGNLKSNLMTAHASGVAWNNGRLLGPEVLSRGWTTGIVLLSELQMAGGLLRMGLPRLDQRADSRPRIGDVPLHERAIIVGADYDLRRSLADGLPAFRDYLDAIIQDRILSGTTFLEARSI